MGEWKAQLSLRVRQALREDLEAIAAHEHRKLGNLSELVLEWGYEQLKEAGNIERLLQCRLRSRRASATKRNTAQSKREVTDVQRNCAAECFGSRGGLEGIQGDC